MVARLAFLWTFWNLLLCIDIAGTTGTASLGPRLAWQLPTSLLLPVRPDGDRSSSPFPCGGNETCYLAGCGGKHGQRAIRVSDGREQWPQPFIGPSMCTGNNAVQLVLPDPGGVAGSGNDAAEICWITEQKKDDILTCLVAATGKKVWSETLSTANPTFPRRLVAAAVPDGGLLLTYGNFVYDDGAASRVGAPQQLAAPPPPPQPVLSTVASPPPPPGDQCTCWDAGLNGGPPNGPGSQSGPGKLPPVCWNWFGCGFTCAGQCHSSPDFKGCKCALMNSMSSACQMSPCSANGTYATGEACMPNCATAAPPGSIVDPRSGKCVQAPPGSNPCACTMDMNGTVHCKPHVREPPAYVSRQHGTTGVQLYNYTLPPRTAIDPDTSLLLADGTLQLLSLSIGGLTCAENPDCSNPLEPPLQNTSHIILMLDTAVTGSTSTAGDQLKWKRELGWGKWLYPQVTVLDDANLILVCAGVGFGNPYTTIALDMHSGEQLWSANGDTVMSSPTAGGGILLSHNDRKLVARSVSDGTKLWTFPSADRPLPQGVSIADLELACSWPTNNKQQLSQQQQQLGAGTAVCLLEFSCEGGPNGMDVACPVEVLPTGPNGDNADATAPKQCNGRGAGMCRFAISPATGRLIFPANWGPKFMPADGSNGISAPQRFGGTMLLFDLPSSLVAVDSKNGTTLWTSTESVSSVVSLEMALPPASNCVDALKKLCYKQKEKGPAACGMCAGQNAGVLHAAGCTDDTINQWCSNGNSNASVAHTVATVANTNGHRTILFAATVAQNPVDGLLLSLDGADGSTLWSVVLPGPQQGRNNDGGLGRKTSGDGSRDDSSGWGTLSVIWAGATPDGGEAGSAGSTIVVYGEYCHRYNSNSLGVWAPPPPPPVVDAVAAASAELLDTAGISRQRRRLQFGPPSPPSPPPCTFEYFTWCVVA